MTDDAFMCGSGGCQRVALTRDEVEASMVLSCVRKRGPLPCARCEGCRAAVEKRRTALAAAVRAGFVPSNVADIAASLRLWEARVALASAKKRRTP